MIDFKAEGRCPSAQTLMEDKVASRVKAKDATLYDFSESARTCAENYMGWATLASNPPCALSEI